MNLIRWSPQAVGDLEAIRDYIARDSPVYAQLLIEEIVNQVDQLESFASLGRVVPEIGREDLRELIVGAYRIVYRGFKGAVEVITICRATRLFPSSLL